MENAETKTDWTALLKKHGVWVIVGAFALYVASKLGSGGKRPKVD